MCLMVQHIVIAAMLSWVMEILVVQMPDFEYGEPYGSDNLRIEDYTINGTLAIICHFGGP